jgi:hypothetical protein
MARTRPAMTKGRSGGRLHARRQIGEAAPAGDDIVELAKFFVAPVVAAFGYELACCVELLARLLVGFAVEEQDRN